MFTAALFMIGHRSNLRCPWTDEWIKKLWYIYRMEYYSAIKMNAFESVLMSKVSQKEINKYHILIYIYRIYMVLMNLFAGQQWRHRHKEQTCGHGEKERVG